ncbi:hypothetical protein BCR34DRAFT_582892 [Clohesyomyces aquaticus]|uniref:Uncharacterized protein n=1 Tax=Clohesyomyces aquaticus TaxID=1231657 RepID=A0A1Y2A987_9PLEO|nr:hypothetical protein BCR34DRAFT_582892 [Clohesyomyces aquaticus]
MSHCDPAFHKSPSPHVTTPIPIPIPIPPSTSLPETPQIRNLNYILRYRNPIRLLLPWRSHHIPRQNSPRPRPIRSDAHDSELLIKDRRCRRPRIYWWVVVQAVVEPGVVGFFKVVEDCDFAWCWGVPGRRAGVASYSSSSSKSPMVSVCRRPEASNGILFWVRDARGCSITPREALMLLQSSNGADSMLGSLRGQRKYVGVVVCLLRVSRIVNIRGAQM